MVSNTYFWMCRPPTNENNKILGYKSMQVIVGVSRDLF